MDAREKVEHFLGQITDLTSAIRYCGDGRSDYGEEENHSQYPMPETDFFAGTAACADVTPRASALNSYREKPSRSQPARLLRVNPPSRAITTRAWEEYPQPYWTTSQTKNEPLGR